MTSQGSTPQPRSAKIPDWLHWLTIATIPASLALTLTADLDTAGAATKALALAAPGCAVLNAGVAGFRMMMQSQEGEIHNEDRTRSIRSQLKAMLAVNGALIAAQAATLLLQGP